MLRCQWRLFEPRGPQPPGAEARSPQFAALRRLQPARLRGGKVLQMRRFEWIFSGCFAFDRRIFAARGRVYKSDPTPNPSLGGGAYRRKRRQECCQIFIKRSRARTTHNRTAIGTFSESPAYNPSARRPFDAVCVHTVALPKAGRRVLGELVRSCGGGRSDAAIPDSRLPCCSDRLFHRPGFCLGWFFVTKLR